MSIASTLSNCRQSRCRMLQTLLATTIMAWSVPALAQPPSDLVSSLKSLPSEAQSVPLQRYRYFYEQRAFPNQQIPPGAYQRALQDHEQKFGAIRPQLPPGPPPPFAQNRWTLIGPSQIATSPTASGRTNTVAIDPTNINIIYVGAAAGGVWKTTNGGTTWTPLTDTQCSTAMGSIAIDPSNHLVVYAGTGEENFSLDSYYGCGVLKSTDGGVTWVRMGASVFAPNGGNGAATIAKIAIHPTTTSTLLVASSLGLYRSTDSGSTFTRVLAGTATDVVIDPANPSTMYAALGNIFGNAADGVYKSTDAGATWTLLGGGLPTSSVGRISLAIAASSSSTLYAAVQNSANFQFLGMWKTINSGSTWSQLSATNATCTFGGSSQCWYDLALAVDPTNANTVYLGTQDFFKSTDGGNTFTDIGGYSGSIHPDQHALTFLPGNASTIIIGNDGGVYKSGDGGSTWTSLNTNLAITEFSPGFSLHPTNGSIAMGGTQDNGTNLTTGSTTWQEIWGGDGGFTAIDFTNPNTLYTENTGATGPYRSDNFGSSFALVNTGIDTSDPSLFYPPLVMSSTTSMALFFGTNKVYKTINQGGAWSVSATTLGGNVAAIAQAPSNSLIVYAGASNGVVYKSTNGNASYAALSGLPSLVPTYIAVHPTDPNTVFVTFSGFSGAAPSRHVWKSTDGGATWADISGNLPDIPTNSIVLDPNAPTTEIFVGTDLGVYRSHDGATWSAFDTGLPNVPVVDLKYNAGTGVLAAATHGRSVWTAIVGPAPTATHDFSADNKSDLLWRNTSSALAVWLMNGGAVLQAAGLGSVTGSLSIVGQHDFNGDGKADILWRDTSGNVSMWFMNGVSVASAASVSNVSSNFGLFGTGDLNGDNKGDLLWRDSNTGTVSVWFMNGASVASAAVLASVANNWTILGDANGNILWRDTAGDIALWVVQGGGVTGAFGLGNVPSNFVVQGAGDFNGDGKIDILWRDNNTGTVSIWFTNGSQVTSGEVVGTVPSNWNVAQVGDYNGDGTSDILWLDSAGDVAMWLMNGSAVSSSVGVGNVGPTWTVQNVNAN